MDKPADDLAAAAVAARKARSLIGHKVSHYEVVSLLGAGGMGEVYRAIDTRLGRHVAIKIAKEQFSERFDREACAIAQLNHRVLDIPQHASTCRDVSSRTHAVYLRCDMG